MILEWYIYIGLLYFFFFFLFWCVEHLYDFFLFYFLIAQWDSVFGVSVGEQGNSLARGFFWSGSAELSTSS